MNLGRAIALCRKQRGYNQAQLAEKAEISEGPNPLHHPANLGSVGHSLGHSVFPRCRPDRAFRVARRPAGKAIFRRSPTAK
jgi:hypothetical protein